jgi:hypothetical protein
LLQLDELELAAHQSAERKKTGTAPFGAHNGSQSLRPAFQALGGKIRNRPTNFRSGLDLLSAKQG